MSEACVIVPSARYHGIRPCSKAYCIGFEAGFQRATTGTCKHPSGGELYERLVRLYGGPEVRSVRMDDILAAYRHGVEDGQHAGLAPERKRELHFHVRRVLRRAKRDRDVRIGRLIVVARRRASTY